MTQLEKGAPSVYVTMFGGFTMRIGDRVLAENGRTKQTWNLLEYLLANRNSDISKEKLIEALWDDSDCGDPANALKNLVYRTRHLINELSGLPDDYIVCMRNTYAWNNAIDCKIDAEEYEEAYREAKNASSRQERLAALYRAIELYKGEYLPKSSMKDWVMINGQHYSRMYIECIHAVCEELDKEKKYDEIINICEKALTIDTYAETIHELLIVACLKAGNKRKAIAYYEYATKLFYEKLGVRLSVNVRNLINETVKSMHGIETNLNVIGQDLKEQKEPDGAYFCDYEVFRNLYRIAARMCKRSGSSVFVALLTLAPYGKKMPSKEAAEAAMASLGEIIKKSLRKSDVVSNYSNLQYILMLPDLSYENGQMVLRRIIDRFSRLKQSRGFIVNTNLNPLS
jgi:DNA-binding SARP family transcriptional activator